MAQPPVIDRDVAEPWSRRSRCTAWPRTHGAIWQPRVPRARDEDFDPSDVYDRYLNDAHSAEHPDVSEFIEHCKRQDEQRSIRAHDLLGELTRKHRLDLEDAEVGGIRHH